MTGTQLSRTPGQGWDSAEVGGEGHVWGSSPAMGCSVLRFKTVKQAQGAKEENFCCWELYLCHPPAVHSLSHSAAQY